MIVLFFLVYPQICIGYEGWEIVAENGIRNKGIGNETDNRYLWGATNYTINEVNYLYVSTSSDFDTIKLSNIPPVLGVSPGLARIRSRFSAHVWALVPAHQLHHRRLRGS